MPADLRADPLAAWRVTVPVAGVTLALAYSRVPAAHGAPLGSVLYVHGLVASRRHWRPVIERLRARGWHQVAVNLPGFGDSASLPRPHRLEDYADALAAFLAALELQPVVVGHSMGGMIAVDLADRYPTRVGGLVLVAPAGLPHPHYRLPLWVRAPGLRELLIAFLALPPVFRRVAPFSVALPPEWTADLRFGLLRSREVKRMRAFYRMPGFLQALARLRQPVALVWGERDRTVPLADARPMLEALQARGKGARLISLAGAGHSPMHERPDAFALALDALLGDCRARAGRKEEGA